MSSRARSVDSSFRSMLVVLPTWVGDFVMATPTLRAIRHRFVEARIVFLMEPNLRDLIRGGDWMDDCVEWPGRSNRSLIHRPYRGLVRQLRRERFDGVILLPNSFRSALLAWLIGANRRVGYDRDGRGFLLTDRVPVKNRRNDPSRRLHPARTRGHTRNSKTGEAPTDELPVAAVDCRSSVSDVRLKPDDETSRERKRAVQGETSSMAYASLADKPPVAPARDHLNLLHPPAPGGKYLPMPIVDYYADLAEYVGCSRPDDKLELFTTPDCEASLEEKLAARGVDDVRSLIVLSPGAKYGAAKCWPTDRFAAAADRLIESESAQVIITCGPGEEPIARAIASGMNNEAIRFDGPLLSLGELKSLIRRADLLICNDAGPRHIAKAFGVPVVTIFGPTHPDWTATSYPNERIVRINVDCGPCQQRICPLGHLDCMTGVSVEMVVSAAQELLHARARCDAASTGKA